MNKIRLKYEKNDEVKYLGHLDTVTVFDRVFRRSDIKIKFSEGFNPRPNFVFALPSGSGLISKSEYIEIELDEDEKHDMKHIIESLNTLLPIGFRILEGKYVDNNKSLMAKVNSSKYEINVFFKDIEDKEYEDIFGRIIEIFNKETILTKKKTKKQDKQEMIDIKPYIMEISFDKITDNNLKGICINLYSKAGSVQNLRPDYIIKVIEDNEIDIYDYQIIRKELILNDYINK